MNAWSISMCLGALLVGLGCGNEGAPGPGGTTMRGSDAGGGTGGGGDAGAGGGAVGDAGGGGGGGGGGGAAPDVPITIAPACEDVTPCGGDLLGSWHYTSGCVEGPFASLYEDCPSATVIEQAATARGTVTVGPDEIVQEANVQVSARVHVPAECSAGMCALIEGALAGAVDSVSCAPSGGGCDCDVVAMDSVVRSDTYTIAGGILTTGDGERYAFCVDGAQMRYQPLDSEETETYTLARR